MSIVPFHAHDAPAHPHVVHRPSTRGFVTESLIRILIFALIGIGALVFLLTRQTVSSFEDCAKIDGSTIQESFPPVCVTPQGQRFTQAGNFETPTPTPSFEPITIESATMNGRVLTITGTVLPGWMFEGSFPFDVKSSLDTTIGTSFAQETVPGSWMGGNVIEFSGKATIRAGATPDSVIFRKDNPSGLPENDALFEAKLVMATPVAQSPQSICETNSGKWISETRECEQLSESICKANKGVYNGCSSPCRNDPNAQVCIQLCLSVCSF